MATIKTKYESVGLGALIQLIGVVLLFFFPFGTAFGIVLLIVGSVASRKYMCSDCGFKVPDKSVKICGNCKETFIKKPSNRYVVLEPRNNPPE
ncbi:MAG: hypothetical protein ACYDHW_07150 [Syntrophorhabdaceae bacterium]